MRLDSCADSGDGDAGVCGVYAAGDDVSGKRVVKVMEDTRCCDDGGDGRSVDVPV